MNTLKKLISPALLSLVGLLAFASNAQAQKFEGLAPTPPMGWNSWNTFATNIHEDLIKDLADEMIANGMRDAGYDYIVLDDGWMDMERDAQGNLVAHPDKFPSGMKALGDYLHERGFKFGIYNCAGSKTCGGYPGSMGHEYQDALKYAEWGVDYLKYDWCYTETRDAKEAYKTMRDALYAAGRPIVLSLCEWGQHEPWTWAQDVGHLWRTTGDIIDCYDCVQQYSTGWKGILDLQMTQAPDHYGLAQYGGPDHWNDPDMMEVGNDGLTFAESRAHFSFWCLIAAPLMAGNDIREMTPEITAVMTDADAIAINQDPLGKGGWRIYESDKKEIWAGERENGDYAIIVHNVQDETAEVTYDWSEYWFIPGEFEIYDIWNKKSLGKTSDYPEKQITFTLESHDVAFLRLKKIEE